MRINGIRMSTVWHPYEHGGSAAFAPLIFLINFNFEFIVNRRAVKVITSVLPSMFSFLYQNILPRLKKKAFTNIPKLYKCIPEELNIGHVDSFF